MSWKQTLKEDIRRLKEYCHDHPVEDYYYTDTDKVFVIGGIVFIIVIFAIVL